MGKRGSVVAPSLRRVAVFVAVALALIGGYRYYLYLDRLIPVGDLRIDPMAEIDPEREYHLIVWEHDVPLPWEPASRRKALDEAIAEFRKVWPNIFVEVQVLPWHADHSRLREALADGNPPDVYGMPLGARKIDADWQVPVQPYLGSEAKDDLLPSAVRALSDEAGLWAWPKWVMPRLWVVREDLTPSLQRGRTSWAKEEFLSALAEAKTKAGANGLLINPYEPNAFFEIMVATTGKNLIGPDGTRHWSVEEIAQGLAFFEELIQRGLTERNRDTMARTRLARFWNRQAAALAPVNPWLLRHLMTRGGVTGDGRDNDEAGHLVLASPPPTLHEDAASPRHPAVVSGYVVFRRQAHPGDDHVRAAMALAEHLSRRLGPWEAARLFAAPAHPSAWPTWREDAGLPGKELDLLIEWSRAAVGPPLDDRFAHVQQRAMESVIATHFPKLWEGGDPSQIAQEIAVLVDGLRAMVKLP